MEGIGWKPLDLIVGGMLTAGVAFSVYKLGATKKGAAAAHLDSAHLTTHLQECIALAGRPSELEVSVLPQVDSVSRRLAANLAKSMKAEYSASVDAIMVRRDQGDVAEYRRPVPKQQPPQSPSSDSDVARLRAGKEDTLQMSPCQSPPKPRRWFPPTAYSSPPLGDKTPPELTRQLQSYRNTLDQWTEASEAKIEKMEQQRMALSTELHVTREALQAERRHRAEAEQRRNRVELQLKELESRLLRYSENQLEASKREAEVQKLEQQVQEMEEQLEGLYKHNVVTPRQAMRQNMLQQQEVAQCLQQAEDELQRQQQDLQDKDNDIANLSALLNKAKSDARQLGEDNALLETQLHRAQRAARDLVALLYERSAGEGSSSKELNELLPDSDLPLDKLLQCVTSFLLHCS